MTAHHQPRSSYGEAEWLCKAKNRVLEQTIISPGPGAPRDTITTPIPCS
jgi:hypothetical protein